MSTFTPLESPKGRDTAWKVKAIVVQPANSNINAVRNIEKQGAPIIAEELANIRPAIDAALVVPSATSTTPASKYAKYQASSDYLIGEQGLTAFNVGGGTKNVFWHKPRYAAVEYCEVNLKALQVPFGTAPPLPKCDALIAHQFIILERDLGSLRQPPFIYFLTFLVLFGLSLLGLHWYELDQRERRARDLAPVPASS
jgi:hypothetical protein